MDEQETVIDLADIARPQGSPFPMLGLEVEEHHANLVISFGPGTFLVQSVTAEQMTDICHKWITRHKRLGTH